MLQHLIEQRLREAILNVLSDADPQCITVRPCENPAFGDYQTSALMGLAKERKRNPRQLAAEVMAKLDLEDCCESVATAGAGFLNFRLRPDALLRELQSAEQGACLFFEKAAAPRTIVIDFSSPNVAKPMHVGHIRSTILGDCLARTLRLLGHRVITDNHIGDWGTQFGKLIVGWKQHLNRAALERDALAEMERLYKLVHRASEEDKTVLEQARQELVKLQQGDQENLRLWEQMLGLSRSEFDRLYERLGVTFDHTLGESFYNPNLKQVVRDLVERGLARESDGAIAVFFDGIPGLKDKPAIVQKSDGAANYTTTDLATLAYRVTHWRPDEIVYVTDGRQQLHFQQLFTTFRRWQPEAKMALTHVWFGTILGEDNRPLKSRTGDAIKLVELLDEAEERAFLVVSEKNPKLDEDRRREIARVVGLGALKYADLLQNRDKDYVFNWDKMLALTGNTAPYVQYAYTRLRGILRGQQDPLASSATSPAIPRAPEELALGKELLKFGSVLESVATEYRPHHLCGYLFSLSGLSSSFYENCPVLKADGALRAMRLLLCGLTARVLKEGLSALAIETLEEM